MNISETGDLYKKAFASEWNSGVNRKRFAGHKVLIMGCEVTLDDDGNATEGIPFGWRDIGRCGAIHLNID